jgi:hypothetical protein
MSTPALMLVTFFGPLNVVAWEYHICPFLSFLNLSSKPLAQTTGLS